MFDVVDGRTATTGDYKIHGVPGTGTRVDTVFYDPGGTTGHGLYPFGEPVSTLHVDGESVEVSIVDVTTPVVFLRAADLGVTGTGLPAAIDSDQAFLDRIERIRATACAELGIVDTPREATDVSPGFPKIAFVAPPTDYDAATSRVSGSELNVTAWIMSMQYLHPVYAVTGASCKVAASLLDGTIPNQLADAPEDGTVVVGDPKGKMAVDVAVEDDRVTSVTVSRTQRRLMEGRAFYTLDTND